MTSASNMDVGLGGIKAGDFVAVRGRYNRWHRMRVKSATKLRVSVHEAADYYRKNGKPFDYRKVAVSGYDQVTSLGYVHPDGQTSQQKIEQEIARQAIQNDRLRIERFDSAMSVIEQTNFADLPLHHLERIAEIIGEAMEAAQYE